MSEQNQITSQTSLSIMESIANNEKSIVNIPTSNESVNQLKIFLVMQAKNELKRIVKLTTYLDTLEARFMDVADMLMEEYPDNISLISETMKTLTACINRSNELVSQVVSDGKLNSFVFTNDQISKTNETGFDITSRTKIRDAANKILLRLNDMSDDDTNNIKE